MSEFTEKIDGIFSVYVYGVYRGVYVLSLTRLGSTIWHYHTYVGRILVSRGQTTIFYRALSLTV